MKLVFYPEAALADASPATLGRGMGGILQPQPVPLTLGETVVVAKGTGHWPGPLLAAVVPCPLAFFGSG